MTKERKKCEKRANDKKGEFEVKWANDEQG